MLVIALCYPENNFNYKKKHKDKKIKGLVCGIHSLWEKEIPELNNKNINTLKAGEIVLNYLLEKNNGDLFEVVREFKGSERNYSPVHKTMKIYKELKKIWNHHNIKLE